MPDAWINGLVDDTHTTPADNVQHIVFADLFVSRCHQDRACRKLKILPDNAEGKDHLQFEEGEVLLQGCPPTQFGHPGS